ncbi:MAG: ABC transporter ATP-binding protein [Ilumatobacteraceae bacterium]
MTVPTTRGPVVSPPLVAVRDVTKSFGSPNEPVAVLCDVDLELRARDKVSLVGPSGCGKSTLLMLIAGLLRPDRGTIEIDGVAMSELGDAQRADVRAHRIGIALQSDNLVPFLSARENVELALGFAGSDERAVVRDRANELLERFSVGHRAEHLPRHLSGGETQRVALAVAMANAPALLLADEVVAALDQQTAADVIAEVLGGDMAVLYVTHDVALADRVDRRLTFDGHTIVER